MGVKITGLKPAMNRLLIIRNGLPSIVENAMEMLFEDIIDQSMENLRNRLKNTTYSRGDESNPERIPLTDNLNAWNYKRTGTYKWKLENLSDHAAPVEHGSRSVIKSSREGGYLYLGNGFYTKSVRGQNPKHFFGDALYYQRDRWEKNLTRYMRTQIRQIVR